MIFSLRERMISVFDLIIDGGFIITMDPKNTVIKNGSIGIIGDKIVKVGESQEFEGIDAKRKIDAFDNIIMPGLIDAHGHAGHGLTKGFGTCLQLGDWQRLMEYIYFENTTDLFWYAEGLLSGAERIKFGTTCGYSMLGAAPRCDEPIYAEQHMEAMREMGIRNIIGIGPCRTTWPRRFVRWRNNSTEDILLTLEEAIKTTKYVLEKWHEKSDLSFVHVSPSGIDRTMGASIEEVQSLFKKLKRLSKEYNTKINAHAYAGHIKFAHEFLKDILGPDTVLAHVTGVDSEEISILADTGTHVTSSPSSRAFIEQRCPVPELIEAGVNVVLSTDGNAPDCTFDLFKELKVAMIEHRSHFSNISYLPPGKVLKMVTIDAAKALGLDSIIGSLVPGKKADIILIDLNSPHLVPKMLEPIRAVYEVTGQDVNTVIIDGKIVMENRVLLTVNEDKIISLAEEETEKMIERANLAKIPFEYEDESFWEGSKYNIVELDKHINISTPKSKIFK